MAIRPARDYLREFVAAPDSALVGAAAALPMSAQEEEFLAQLEAIVIDTGTPFCFGESVLLPEYREGIGHTYLNGEPSA